MDFDFTRVGEMLAGLEIAFKYECFSISVDTINICRFPPSGGFDFHMHSNFEFHYIKAGKGNVILGEVEYTLGAGDFYITGPGLVHKQVADSFDPMVEYALQCEIVLEMTENQINKHSMEEYSCIFHILKSKTVTVVKDMNHLDRIFERLFKEAHDKRVGYYTGIKNLVLQIIIASSRNFDEGDPAVYRVPQRDIDAHRMAIVKAYILDNICRNITCEELANHLFLSTRQLNRIIRDKTGYSVHEFVMQQKMERVKEILCNSGHTLNKIAEWTGFSSEFHLSHAFKKWVGVSPAKFRETQAG